MTKFVHHDIKLPRFIISPHAKQRIIQRGIKIEHLKYALEYGIKNYTFDNRIHVYCKFYKIGIVLNDKFKTIITVYEDDKRKVNSKTKINQYSLSIPKPIVVL